MFSSCLCLMLLAGHQHHRSAHQAHQRGALSFWPLASVFTIRPPHCSPPHLLSTHCSPSSAMFLISLSISSLVVWFNQHCEVLFLGKITPRTYHQGCLHCTNVHYRCNFDNSRYIRLANLSLVTWTLTIRRFTFIRFVKVSWPFTSRASNCQHSITSW